jgi:hypothetical protein
MTIAIYDTSAPMFFDGKLLGVTALKSCSGNKLALLPLDEGSNPSGAANILRWRNGRRTE